MSSPSASRLSVVAATAVLLLTAGACTSVLDLKVGDCFNADDSTEQSTVQTLDCASAHRYEVYAVFDEWADAGSEYPGNTEISSVAQSSCESRFEGFVGMSYQDSELYVSILFPSADTWADGDREVVCSVYLPGEELTGSMRNSNR